MAKKKQIFIDNKNGTFTYEELLLVRVTKVADLKISDTIYIMFSGKIEEQTFRSRYPKFETQKEYDDDYIRFFIEHFIKENNLYMRKPSDKKLKSEQYDI
jgi:hypothetical protein